MVNILSTDKPVASRAAFEKAFAEEKLREYPGVAEYLTAHGLTDTPRPWLEQAARVLACPVKVNPPNWQHGRLIFGLAYEAAWRLRGRETGVFVDIGTAKGFSALCARAGANVWADMSGEDIEDVEAREKRIQVISCDVIDPQARVPRNTVAEVDGMKTLLETIDACGFANEPARGIDFYHMTGIEMLTRGLKLAQGSDRVPFAFIDGKHIGDIVHAEFELISRRQYEGDVILVDDLQLRGLMLAFTSFHKRYHLETLPLSPDRIYGIARKR